MRILTFVSDGHLPQMMGGTQAVANDINHFLLSCGHAVVTLTPIIPSGILYYCNRLKSRILKGNPCPCDRGLGYDTFRGWNTLECLNHVVGEFHPDIAIIHGGRGFLVANRICDLGIPALIYFHDVAFSALDAPPPKSELAHFIANSQFTAEEVRKEFAISCHIMQPYTVLDKYICKRVPRFVTMINPISAKGLDVVISAAESRPDIPFLLVKSWGYPGLYEEAERITKSIKNITLHKSVTDMRKVYRSTKVLLMPSIVQEAWGRTAVEAQMNGIPVIARRIGGLPEAVGRGGILLPPAAPSSAWISALSQLWDSDAAYQEASKLALEQAAQTKSTLADAARDFHELCRNVLQRPSAIA